MKKYIYCLLLFSHIAAYAQEEDVYAVRRFGNSLQEWCSTEDISFRFRLQDMCASACRVKDEIMMDFARNSGISIKDYVVQNYLNGFETAMSRGKVTVDVSNIRVISSDQQSYSAYATRTEERKARKFTTIACDVRVNGTLNYDIKDLFYVHKGEILKITPYEEVVDKKTGKKKVRVDFSDLYYNSTIGFSYNYGQNFPVGGSFNYSTAGLPFMVSVDIGVNLDNDKYIIEKVDMKDIENYDRVKKVFDPKCFLTITPQLYLRYFAIGCGVGLLYMDGTEETTCSSSDSSAGSKVSLLDYRNAEMFKPMIRPVAKGFIPLNIRRIFTCP